MLNLTDLRNTLDFKTVALFLANKVAFNRDKAVSAWDQTYWDFARGLDKHLSYIENHLEHYKFKPAILVEKKVKFKVRKLYISDWRDKLVEMWLNRALNLNLSGYFLDCSYAYRTDGGSVISCQMNAQSAVPQHQYFLKRDIKDFYYTIDQDLMLEYLSKIVPTSDPLFSLIAQRIKFKYYGPDRQVCLSQLGLPFGSPLACVLANIYLHDVDVELSRMGVEYFRYADDFLVCGSDPDVVKAAAQRLDQLIDDRRLKFGAKKSVNASFIPHPDFITVNRLSYLGIEYWNNGVMRLPIEKRRKLINIVKSVIVSQKYALKRIRQPHARARYLSAEITRQLKSRIRNAAIVDYFLANVNDEDQLESMDRQISELIIAACTGKKFRLRHYKLIPYALLRRSGLMSLLHRSRLLRSREIKLDFLSLFNRMSIEKILKSIELRRQRVETMKLRRALKKDL
jgi:hypothetical protein